MCKIIYTGETPRKEIFSIFSDVMTELIGGDKDVVYIDADLMSSMRSKDLWVKYPKNVFNTGIQEANMIGVAAGMYLYGKKPYVHSFAPFATRRCFDQVYVSIGYAKKGLRIIGSEPGICATDNGGTHMTFEDIALMRTIPGSVVIDISDGKMFGEVLRMTKDMDGVIYIRTTRRGLPDVYADNEKFTIGKAKKLYDGGDCTVIASGIMLATSIEASRILQERGISIDLIDPVSIKPIDRDLIISSVKKTGKAVTIENHNINGGLGGAVAELLTEEYPVRLKRLGIHDMFGQVGTEQYLREQYHLTVEDLVETIQSFIQDSVL